MKENNDAMAYSAQLAFIAAADRPPRLGSALRTRVDLVRAAPRTASPPDGRYVPARGFGKVWAAQPELREQLGWAIDPEPQASRVDYQHFSGGLFVRVYATNTVYALRDFRGPPPHAQLIAAVPQQ